MDQSLRQRTATSLRNYSKAINLDGLIAENGSPLLILDTSKLLDQYQTLCNSLPGFNIYYALKALSHPAVVAALVKDDGYIDVASTGELDMALANGMTADRILYTHPIKRVEEIKNAYEKGVRLFVVDNHEELKKFANIPNDLRLMVRLSFQNADAQSDLSYKFGATIDDARTIVADAVKQGSTVGGFCLHVGTQMPRAEAYSQAVKTTIELMDELEVELKIKFTLLDIGGGFPVQYCDPIPSINEIAELILPLLEPLKERVQFMAEPGRFVAAPAVLAVAQVIGKSVRHGMPWYYLDDGLYGSYGGLIMWENTIPFMLAHKELSKPMSDSEFKVSALAGPTCDSADMVTNGYLLPDLNIGDYLLTPNMGAYTLVSATDFNGIEKARVVVVESGREV